MTSWPRRFWYLLNRRRYERDLAGLALLLASLGVYGVLSYTIAQRRREMSLRMALGAEPRALVGWIVSRGLRPVMTGLVVAYALAQTIGSLLYGVRPRDPLTFGAAGIVLLIIAALACLLPARRAARLDPAVFLRSE